MSRLNGRYKKKSSMGSSYRLGSRLTGNNEEYYSVTIRVISSLVISCTENLCNLLKLLQLGFLVSCNMFRSIFHGNPPGFLTGERSVDGAGWSSVRRRS
jgi:hypothetical protein